MKSFLPITLIGILTFLLLGCDYKSPITTTPSRGIDKQLIGVWHENRGHGLITITPYGAKEYLIKFQEDARKRSKPDYYFAYHSTLDGVDFLNVHEKDAPSVRYNFFTYQFSKDRLVIYPIHLEPLKEKASSFAIRQEIRKKIKTKSIRQAEHATTWHR